MCPPLDPKVRYDTEDSWIGLILCMPDSGADETSYLWVLPESDFLAAPKNDFDRFSVGRNENSKNVLGVNWSYFAREAWNNSTVAKKEKLFFRPTSCFTACKKTVSVWVLPLETKKLSEEKFKMIVDWLGNGLKESLPRLAPATAFKQSEPYLVAHQGYDPIVKRAIESAKAWREALVLKETLELGKSVKPVGLNLRQKKSL